MSDSTTDLLDSEEERNDSYVKNNSNSDFKRDGASWTELKNKAIRRIREQVRSGDIKQKSIMYIAGAGALGVLSYLLLPFSMSATVSIFAVSMGSALTNRENYVAAGVAGGALSGLATIVTSFLTVLATIGLALIPAVLVGAIAGVAGVALGDILKSKLR